MHCVDQEQLSETVLPHCRNTKMEKILFGFIGASLAVGGAYFVYRKWQKYQQQYHEKNNEVCNTRLQLIRKK